MRSRKKSTLAGPEVKAVASSWITEHLPFSDYGRTCPVSVIVAVLLFAASRMRSIHDACQRLRNVPCDQTVRDALRATLPPLRDLEASINAALGDRLPKPFFRRGQRVAIDLTEIPYHGKPATDPREIRRSQPKSGTTHFHAYATAYVVQRGQRYTLAMTYVFGQETLQEVLKRLMRQIQKLGVKIRFLLLDKAFFNAEVVRYLQAARYPFLMPAFARGRKPKTPRPGSLHALRARKKSGWGRYSWTNKSGRRATVQIAVVCKNYAGSRKRRGRRTQLYAYWGIEPRSFQWVYETYRKRFGIETSYRQMNEVRIRTCSRSPLLRLLFVGLALILRNVWVWCHLNWLADRYGRGIQLHQELLRMSEMTLWFEYLLIEQYQLILEKPIPKRE